jgi:transposase
MKRPQYYVGIDVASNDFYASVGQLVEQEWQLTHKPRQFGNDYDSLPKFLHWLQQNQIKPDNSVICMEATGVYNEVLAHFLVANGYAVAIQPPLEVKRAFKPVGHKTDPVDSGQIAEYAYRFFDELHLWTPREQILEQIKTLLTTREQFCMQKIAHINALKALQRKYVRTPLAEKLHEDTITHLKTDITAIEREIERLIDQDPTYRQLIGLMMTIPGVGLLLASHLLVTFQSSPQPYNPKALSAFIGICPYQKQSGTSVRGAATSRHYGPPGLRRLLYLAALSVRTHHPYFRHYFIRKVQEGKSKKLVINNIANKLLRIVCAVLRTQTPFIFGYRSVHPQLLNLKQPLTMS